MGLSKDTAEDSGAQDAPQSIRIQNERQSSENDTIREIEREEKEKSTEPNSTIQLSDLVGNYGSYQVYLTLLLFIRYLLLGLMANSGSLLAPDVVFYCDLPFEEVKAIIPNITLLSRSEQEQEIREEFKEICQLDSHLYQGLDIIRWPSKSRYRECDQFKYDNLKDQGRTVTSEFDLVCQRESLRSVYQCLVSAAIVVGYVFWGTFSDRYGRFKAQKLCLFVSLIAGAVSILAWDFWSFVIARSISSFGDLGIVVSLTTSVVELVGNKYRGFSVALVNFGYALGVALLPYFTSYFEDFRLVIAYTVLCHLITMPMFLFTDESVRWLLTNRRLNEAERELKRIKKWNSNVSKALKFKWLMCLNERKKEETEEKYKKTKEDFKFKLECLIEQLESQNLCDPKTRVIIDNEDDENDSDNEQDLETDICNQRTNMIEATYNLDSRFKSMSSIISANAGSTQSSLYESLASIDFEAIECNNGIDFDYRSVNIDIEEANEAIEPYSNDNNRISSRASRMTRPRSRAQNRSDSLRGRSTVCQHPDCINIVAHQLSFVGRINRLFRDKQLMIAVFTLFWTTFNSELQYASYIIINIEVGEDLYLNYILGACMEALAAIMAFFLLSYAPRRESLIGFWILISVSCLSLSIAHIDSHWAVWLLALAKFSQSSLSSIANVAAYESFPTFLRQSGSGLVFTLGMLGSVFAPVIFAEYNDHDGMDRVLMTFSFFSLTAAILIYLFLKETRNCELQ